MDDLDLLRTLAGADPAPSPDGQAHARAALLNRISATVSAEGEPSARRRKGRLGWRIAIPAVAAAVAVAGILMAENAGPVGNDGRVHSVVSGVGAHPANAAEAVGYAADAAARKPYRPPRADQWLYLENRSTVGTGPGGLVIGGPYHTVTNQTWTRVDGKQAVTYQNGKRLQGTALPPGTRDGGSPLKWAQLAALPANPDAVLAWIRTQTHRTGTGEAADQAAYEQISSVLSHYLLPPAVEAAFFRALSELPGVTLVPGTVDVDGHQAIAVARVAEGWLRQEILLDPKTYTLIGVRSVAVADHTSTALDGNWTIRKGTVQRYEVRVTAAIVDQPSQPH
ncbi:CU044_5270 family protein [Actinoplanes subtropicus]|uniref:CU044_5270 family protein n=1 Tax=Actinoplanes subtropicus TaxID=543632 RepID=UPI0004C3E71C|nr:CU044_5270 family protein [Actinoplanes subtropicus]